MCLSLNARASTNDLDALFEPKDWTYKTAEEMSTDYDLPHNWLNDSVKGFLSSNNNTVLHEALSNLKIYVAQSVYLFAMKAYSARTTEGSKDIDDLKFLVRHLGIKDVGSAIALISDYFPINRIPTRTKYILADILERDGGFEENMEQLEELLRKMRK